MASRKQHSTAAHKATVAAGDIFAIPVKGHGFGTLVVARPPAPKPAVPLVFGFVYPHVRPSVEASAKVPPLEEWGTAAIVLVPERAIGAERWPRAGRVENFVPEEWPVVPEGRSETFPLLNEAEQALELSWIETTRDEPTRTILECHGVEKSIAQRFPTLSIFRGASYLEAALTRRVKGLRPGFWDSPIEFPAVDAAVLKEWREWANAARVRGRNRREPAFPAGRITDRRVAQGDWLGIPIAGGGFSPLLVVRREAGVVIFGDAIVYGFPVVFDHYPTPEEIDHLRPEDACVVEGTSLIGVAEGRWRLCGSSSQFRIHDWPIPYSWSQDPKQKLRGEATVMLPDGECDISITDEELALADGRFRGMAFPSYIEHKIGFFARFSKELLANNERLSFLTPERFSNWRRFCELVTDPRLRRSSTPQSS